MGDEAAPLPPHPPSTYMGVGVFFVVAAIAASIFGYVALQAEVHETPTTNNAVADSMAEGANGVLTAQTGWLAMGVAVICAAVAIACFVRASKSEA